MSALRTDELVKPDMRAVLSRTHLALDLHHFLLPTFEAVSNAMHGIEEKFGHEANQHGKIHIHFIHPNNPKKLKITVTDNGIGLNDDEYKSFRTPFSGHKLSKHGRGFGRFIAFKVFARTIYRSRYVFFQTTKTARFNLIYRAIRNLPSSMSPRRSTIPDCVWSTISRYCRGTALFVT